MGGRSRETERQVPAADFIPAEQTQPPSVSDGIKPRACDLRALYAFALYLTLSIIVFGRGLFGYFSDFYFGIGVDPGLMMWSLVWWPHALAHDLNPFLTKIIWAPLGFNLTWSTTITLASLLFAPLTLTIGPVATYNVLCLMSLPIDALCAFILCWHITRDYSASLLGGYIFGFSPFMLGQLTSGHLHLLLAFSVPLSLYLVLLRTDEQISRLNFILLLASILFAQLLLSLEIFATITMFGALGLLLSWSFSSDQYRETILDLVAPIACAYCVATVAAAPYFYYFFIYSVHLAPDSTAAFFSADPLNLLVPTPSIELGRFASFSSVSAGFIGGWTGEAGAYISLPLLLIAVVFAYRHWPEREGKLLGYGLAAVILLSLGPTLNINLPAFPFRIALPWWILAKLPLLKNAYPARFTMYTFLLLAIISACYLARDLSTASARAILTAALIIFSLPNTSAAYWLRPLDTPGFLQGRHISALPVEGGECPDSAVFVYGEQYALAGANEDVFRYGRRYHCASSQRLSTMAYFPKPDQARIRSRCRRTVQGVCGGAPCHRNNRH